MNAPFTPVMPHRPDTFAPAWKILLGDRSRNSIAGWTPKAFELFHMRRRFGPWVIHIISDPTGIKHVLSDNAANYVKPALVRRVLGSSGGRSLIMADGEDWRMQRRTMAPVFTPAVVAALVPTIVEAARAGLRRWPAEGRVNITSEATRVTFDVITRALFSGERAMGSRMAGMRIGDALASLGTFRLTRLFGLDLPSRDPVIRRGRVGGQYLLDAVTRQVEARMGSPEPSSDFLGRLIAAFSADRPRDEAAQLTIANAVAFYIAGHETTANALTWTMYLLSGHPEAQAHVREEAEIALAAGPTAESLAAMRYTRAVLDEALRLYPPAPRFDREALADDEVAGATVRKGEIVSIWPWLIHRHVKLWDEPDAFRPERFLDAKPPRYSYLPFGAGPRVCIGAALSVTEALAVIAVWTAARRFTPVEGHVVEPTADVTLKPSGGLPLRVGT